jgi:hypothetical protein
MTSDDFISRKAVQSEAQYRREVAELGQAARGVHQAEAKVRGSQQRFWSEVALASTAHPRSAPQAAAAAARAPGPTEGAARLAAAHQRIVCARQNQADARSQLGVHQSRVVRADALQKRVQQLCAEMKRHVGMRRENRTDDALADQLAATLARPSPQSLGTPYAPLRRVGVGGRDGAGEGSDRGEGVQQMAAAAGQRWGAEGPVQPLRGDAAMRSAVGVVTPTASGASSAQLSVASGMTRIEQVEVEHAPAEVTVRVRCSLQGGSAVQVALTRAGPGALQAVVESPHAALAAQVRRESAAIVAKLGARGVQVEALEVRDSVSEGAGGTHGLTYRARTRRRAGDDGEEDETKAQCAGK